MSLGQRSLQRRLEHEDLKLAQQNEMSDEHLQHLVRFYSILGDLERHLGGARRLADCCGRMGWPARGVYFFREAGENRSDSGEGPRIVSVALML
jgi:hypothetical protein